jgi:hypothetical protein
MKLGRKRPAPGLKKLKLSKYLKPGLPAPPTSVDYSAKATASLSQVMLNQDLGDCTCAAVGHLVGVFTGNAGQCVVVSDADVEALYEACGGYVPGDPSTDNGCDEVTVLQYWQSTGIANGHKIAGFLSVDATNPVEVQTAIWLFENVYFGVELPDAWISPFPSSNGFVWDVAGAPDPNNGHAFPGIGYDASGNVTICSWGLLGQVTQAALEEYASGEGGGELYCVISQETIARASGKAPNGFDFATLVQDFDAMGGTVPAVAPTPLPPPPPAPAPAPAPVPDPDPTPAPAPTPPDSSRRPPTR